MSGSNDNLMWNMSTYTKTAEYLPWIDGEPDNNEGRIEDAMLVYVSSMLLFDVGRDISARTWYSSQIMCHICELN